MRRKSGKLCYQSGCSYKLQAHLAYEIGVEEEEEEEVEEIRGGGST